MAGIPATKIWVPIALIINIGKVEHLENIRDTSSNYHPGNTVLSILVVVILMGNDPHVHLYIKLIILAEQILVNLVANAGNWQEIMFNMFFSTYLLSFIVTLPDLAKT